MSGRASAPNMASRLTRSGAMIAAGLAVEAISFVWVHPTSFLLFAFLGVGLVALGVVSYLWAIART
ncbi:MAG: hypothetical protein ABIV06_10225 [Thermoanaerobaculia bacterium]